MEKIKSCQRRRKEKLKSNYSDDKVPDAPTLEEFECLLGESPSNYPKVEGIENMESELHSAAIDTNVYEKQNKLDEFEQLKLNDSVKIVVIDETRKNDVDIDVATSSTSELISIDQVDSVESNSTDVAPSAPKLEDDVQRDVDETVEVKEEEQTSNESDVMIQIENNSSVNDDSNSKVLIKTNKIKIIPFNDNQLNTLYNNKELAMIESFISEFIDTQVRIVNGIYQHHKLYELIINYLRIRNNLILNNNELENIKKNNKEILQNLWHLEKASITESGECQDGNPVTATHEYSIAHFHQDTLITLSKYLTTIKELLHNDKTLSTYESEILKLQIDYYIQRVIISCKQLMDNDSDDSIINLIDVDCKSLQNLPQLMELKICITILFYFQRRIIKDEKFILETREWLSKLISILLRLATWQDHLFILNHILRCPGGVTNWAINFIQMPTANNHQTVTCHSSTLNDPYLDHVIATLVVILLPIKERDKFLEQHKITFNNSSNDNNSSPSDTVWVMLDQEGEEDEDISNNGINYLFESDLINLLNQIPLNRIFEKVLLIIENGNDYYQDDKGITEHYILKLFSFSTVIIRILKKGLKTYDTPRYRQLTKKLCAYIRDVVEYISDQWEAFDKTNIYDTNVLLRLQTEYDCLFLRATMAIFSSRRLGAWQYLAAIPYHLVSINTLWLIFYTLHKDITVNNDIKLKNDDINIDIDTDVVNIDMYEDMNNEKWENELNSLTLCKQFENKLLDMPGDESYFLLTTFTNMAIARNHNDYDFIRATTINLFQIGFLNEKTQDSCSKDARSLLYNLTNKYPTLISDMLNKLNNNFVSIGKLSLYLFTELNIKNWIPNQDDINILSSWLYNHSLSSTESHLARLILNNLNWGFQSEDKNSDIYLPRDLHYKIALLIVDLTIKFVPDLPGQTSSSLITEGVKQMSSYIVKPQNNEQAFGLWAWEMIKKLRLHQLDLSYNVCHNVMTNPANAFSKVPNLDSDESLQILLNGIRQKQPIACYVSIMMTLWGHSIPLICTKGFTQLSILQCYYKYEQIIIILYHIVPLFIECPESLLQNERFNTLIISLVTADRTYVKIARNLIAPEFPGPVIKHFSNMIQSQMYHYKRYFLQSPEPLIRLWLNIFITIPDWNRDNNVLFLMDIIIQTAFFHLDAKATSENLFQTLLSNVAGAKSSGSIGSFLHWATGFGNSPSLLDIPTQSVWLGYQILLLEQQNKEEKTGLWREFLRELSQQTKTSLDNALKKACASLKIPSFNSSNLAIFRWSQQALNTSFDHPLLPILWQNFFILFLSRIPTDPGSPVRGGLGDKFFEGMINFSYLKKLKKRLNDTVEYFQTKGEGDMDNERLLTDERRVFYLSMAKFYKTMTLWLEEPRLQESCLYLPALPPQYMSQKLILLMQGDHKPWLEYLDYQQVQEYQWKLVSDWEKTCHRSTEENKTKAIPSPSSKQELIISPIERIYKRLNSYEKPAPPPPIPRINLVIDNISTDIVYTNDKVINCISSHLKVIIEYAKTYNLMVNEHTAVDCHFLELIPTLYKQVDNVVTLHALCDSSPSSSPSTSLVGQQKSTTRCGTPPVVHCAGPAVIRIQISEAKVNDGVDELICKNRGEYETLLIKACQSPPSKLIQGCVYINYIIDLLENELNINSTNESTDILKNLKTSGVDLFYYLIENLIEEISLCPPTKQFITTCIEKLGQLFINGEENQGPILLNTIIQRQNLGGILGPHFTPVAGSASTFLQMYQTIVELTNGGSNNIDLCFVLLSKFDISNWLNYRRPRLTERSTFIDLIIKALCYIGLNPKDDKLIIHELFRNHLKLILFHEFPEHYGEILSCILKGSEGQNLSVDVWKDLLNVLNGKYKNLPGINNSNNSLSNSNSKIREEIRRYATEQRLLSGQEIYDTAILLSKHFMNERLQYGLYGLYPKYRVYNEPIIIFLGMIGHALVVTTLQFDRGSLADDLCDKIWPVLSEMFSPWITPYWTRNLREPTAAWIQQLTDDRSVLLPWIITDGPYANKTVAMFVECIRFIIDTMPASSKILCFLWQFYVVNFAHTSVKDHILNVIHGNFISLPWDKFIPGVNDVEFMVKVVDQFLPDSHLFLGSIFVCINWTNWINQILSTQSLTVAARMHVCLLNLLVKLSNEPNVRQNGKAIELITEAEKYSWHLVDSTAYDQVINWYVMSCEPRVILFSPNSQIHSIDLAINNLLKIVAAYDPTVTHYHPTTLKKRQIYIRSAIKLLINCTTRHKTLISSNSKVFINTLSKILDEMELIIINSVSEAQQTMEASLLITELLHSINQSVFLLDQLRISWCNWLSNKNRTSPILLGIIRVIGISITSPSILGELMEISLESYFKQSVIAVADADDDNDNVEPTWGFILSIIQPVVPKQPPIETVLVHDARILGLYSILMKRLPSCRDIREEGMLLVNLTDWITAIKPNDTIEEKLPLLWSKAFELAYRQCQYSENTVIASRSLKRLARALMTIADDTGQGWGILGAIGIRKGSQLSTKCKFLARALAVYCLAQLPDSKYDQQIIRFTPHSLGSMSIQSNNDADPFDIRPNQDAIKGVQFLETLLTNKQYNELKSDIEQAIKIIRDSANSLHNAVAITGLLSMEIYTKRYLHILSN